MVPDTQEYSLPTVIEQYSLARVMDLQLDSTKDAGLSQVVSNTLLERKSDARILRHSRSGSDVSFSSSSRSGSSLLDDGSQHEDNSAEAPHMLCASGSTQSQQSSSVSHHMAAAVVVTVATTARTPTSAMQAASNPNLPSAGSAQHDQGQCKPCCFFRRSKCLNALDCNYCHSVHPNVRPGKQAPRGACPPSDK